MVTARQVLKLRQTAKNRLGAFTVARRTGFLVTAVLGSLLLFCSGCGETAKPVVSAATGQVDNYFGGPFNVTASSVKQSAAIFDHSANQVAVSGGTTAPVELINGTFTSSDTGFLAITESLAPSPSTGFPAAQNPAITGAWAVEIPGAGTLANFLTLNAVGSSAAPTAMAQNTACPNFTMASPFLYVTVPYKDMNHDFVDYGIVNIQSQGSAVTLSSQPFLIGSNPQTTSTVTGGCSQTLFGTLTAYPLNSYGYTGLQPELIGIGSSGLLVSSFFPTSSGGLGAFGGGTGVMGVAEPSAPLDVNSVISAKYDGFIFSPENRAQPSDNGYDVTVLASAFGNHSATSQACSTLQASLVANNSPGGMVPVLPSPNSIYGGEFLIASATGSVNDPTGASGSENCDVAIDLGAQDPNNGLFPNATVFIGSNFPPFSISSPCAACALSFPAAAVVGQVKGQYVIFVAASSDSTPPAQLPNGANLQPQPVGIYLFQKM